MEHNSKSDFSIIFDEMEKFHQENPSFISYINEEDINNDQEIRALSDICNDIKSTETAPVVYLTFS